MVAESIKAFENSLRDYLIGVVSDSYETQEKVRYKYNNLKVFMDIKKVKEPHFFVSAGISGACYSLDPLEKKEGSMGTDDAYILRWASRPNIYGELVKHYKFVSQALTGISTETIEDGAIVNEKNKTKEETEEELAKAVAEAITGAGIRKRDTVSEKRQNANLLKDEEDTDNQEEI